MTINDRSITEQLPDLPGLESAEAGVSQRLIAMGVLIIYTGFIAALCIWGYRLYRPFMGEMLVPATVGVALLALLVLWVIVRLALGVYSWKTDERGLTMRGPIIRRFVAWGDVEDAWSGQGTSDLFYHLQTNGGAIRVNVESRRDAPGLYASIRQHLRRLGRAGSLDLPENALSLWDVIPDEVPNTIHWTNPHPPKLWGIIIPGLILVAMATGCVWIAVVGAGFAKGIAALGVLVFGSVIWSTIHDLMRTALSVSLGDDRLEVQTARKSVTIPWSEVVTARWANDANCAYGGILIAGRNAPDTVSIPYWASDDDSGKLVLAVIRRLRTAGVPQALIIPELLRAQAGPARIRHSIPESAEIRLTIRERMLIMLLPAFVALAVGLGGGPQGFRPTLLSVSFAAGVLAVSWLASGTYALRADPEGVRKKFLGLSRLIRWDDIARYEIGSIFKHGVRHRRFLKDSNGKVLTELWTSFGSLEMRERFWSILEARLSQSWRQTEPAAPWKARPWTPPVTGD